MYAGATSLRTSRGRARARHIGLRRAPTRSAHSAAVCVASGAGVAGSAQPQARGADTPTTGAPAARPPPPPRIRSRAPGPAACARRGCRLQRCPAPRPAAGAQGARAARPATCPRSESWCAAPRCCPRAACRVQARRVPHACATRARRELADAVTDPLPSCRRRSTTRPCSSRRVAGSAGAWGCSAREPGAVLPGYSCGGWVAPVALGGEGSSLGEEASAAGALSGPAKTAPCPIH